MNLKRGAAEAGGWWLAVGRSCNQGTSAYLGYFLHVSHSGSRRRALWSGARELTWDFFLRDEEVVTDVGVVVVRDEMPGAADCDL